MNLKANIRKGLLMSLWVLLGTGVLILLIAAIKVKNHKVCKAVKIAIKGDKEWLFLNEQDIMNIISGNGRSDPRGMAIAGFDLQGLENRLESKVWVKHAELFFDNNRVLHANVEEREPVARIFTTTGSSFYMDSTGKQLPLSNRMNIRLPVFTGFPSGSLRFGKRDSVLVDQIRKMSRFILSNKFWMAQIAQVDISDSRTFELIPAVGHHVIDFGSGENHEEKFRRLFIFYKQVLSQAGFDKYSRVNVQYDNQVVGTRKGIGTRIDSVQALKNIQKMIQDAKRMAEDSSFELDNISLLPPADSTLAVAKGAKPNTTSAVGSGAANRAAGNKVKVPAKDNRSDSRVRAAKPVKNTTRPASKPPAQKPGPKAVMEKRTE